MTVSPITWQNLRVLDGSQQNAFEELCCQLFRAEPPVERARFVRKGAPDAGVEAFWTLPAGDEHGLQAKFFVDPPTSSQWAQIDKSVRTFLDKHPHMTRYIVCLPLDRSDARNEREKSMLDRWNERVEKWRGWAGDRGRSVEFDYWGQSDIVDRLTQERHAGRIRFWFGATEFSEQWFRTHIAQKVAVLKDRYFSAAHVELEELSTVFDGLACAPAFFAKLSTQARNLRRAIEDVRHHANSDAIRHVAADLLDASEAVLFEAEAKIPDGDELRDPVNPILWDAVEITAGTAIERCADALKLLEAKNGSDLTKDERTARDASWRHLFGLQRELEELASFKRRQPARAAVGRVLLLAGEGGKGKSHWLGHLATTRVSQSLPTILLLGEQFSLTDPWSEVASQVGLPGTSVDGGARLSMWPGMRRMFHAPHLSD